MSKLQIMFAAGAAAEVTTSFWMPAFRQNMGFVGSVISAEEGTTAVKLEFDDDTNTASFSDSFSNIPPPWTMTIGPSHWEWSFSSNPYELPSPTTEAPSETSAELDFGIRLACDREEGDADCTRFDGVGYASLQHCMFPVGSSTTPDWCNSIATSVPKEFTETAETIDASSIYTKQLVITAGEEKLSATTGGTASHGGAQSTGTTAGQPEGTGAGATTAEGTGAAAPMRTAAPALAGLGAAVAAFML